VLGGGENCHRIEVRFILNINAKQSYSVTFNMRRSSAVERETLEWQTNIELRSDFRVMTSLSSCKVH
jgi:hypothetical protein